MTDLIRQETALRRAPLLPPTAPPPHEDVPLGELEICHLRTADEINRVLHLRRQIALPASALSDPQFGAREKKETGWASWPDSVGGECSSERFASFLSDSAWLPAKACW